MTPVFKFSECYKVPAIVLSKELPTVRGDYNTMKTLLDILAGIGVLILFVFALHLCGCEDDCTEDDTRCNENTVQQCVDGDWEEMDVCEDQVNFDLELVPMTCCETADGAQCMEECE